MIDKIRMKKHFAAWYFIIGLALLPFLGLAKPGVYYGSIHGSFHPEEAPFIIRLDAESEPTWHWVRLGNYRYSTAELKVSDESEKVFYVDLVNNTFTSDGKTSPLDKTMLAEQMNIKDPAEASLIFERLSQMRDGTFPRPRHHSYFFDEPMRQNFTHFDLMVEPFWAMWFFIAWLLIWPVFLIWCKAPKGAGWFTPRKAFILTIGTVVIIEILIIGFCFFFSPGPASETMEFFIGMLNLPILFLTASPLGFHPIAMLINVLIWGILVSMIAMWRLTPPQEEKTQETSNSDALQD